MTKPELLDILHRLHFTLTNSGHTVWASTDFANMLGNGTVYISTESYKEAIKLAKYLNLGEIIIDKTKDDLKGSIPVKFRTSYHSTIQLTHICKNEDLPLEDVIKQLEEKLPNVS